MFCPLVITDAPLIHKTVHVWDRSTTKKDNQVECLSAQVVDAPDLVSA